MRAAATGLAVVAIFVGATTTGCGGDDEASSATSSETSSASASTTTSPSAAASSAPAEPSDYTTLLIKPEDVGPDTVTDGPPIVNPSGVNGAGQTFKNPEGTRFVIDTVAVFDTPAAASEIVPHMKETIAQKISGAPQPVDIGSD